MIEDFIGQQEIDHNNEVVISQGQVLLWYQFMLRKLKQQEKQDLYILTTPDVL